MRLRDKLLLAALLFPWVAISNELWSCFEGAGRYYNVNPYLLYAIAKVESNLNPKAFNRNRNGTYDIGIMQINSFWLPKIRKYGGSEKDLWEPCYNIYIGAWVLSQCIHELGLTWKAIDCYNKGKGRAKERSRYVMKVFRELEKMGLVKRD